jgi:uroporphyrinogen III methyltransferase/synthase
MSTDKPGIVYLVGAGPGDPGLLTRRGAEVLSRADVVLYDHLASSLLLDLAPAHALRVCAGKSSGHCTMSQDSINEQLRVHGIAGRTVVRLKGGDPLLFGRGGEEAEFLRRHGIPFEIVPGVTAGLGATAYAGIPVTHRAVSSAVAFVTGHGDPEAEGSTQAGRSRLDWPTLARFPGTLVIYMGVTHLAAIARTLMKHGKPAETPAAVVASGTLPSQQVVRGTLETLGDAARAAGVKPPALMVIGEVVERRDELSWFEARPLFGQRIVVTRPMAEAATSASLLESLGAEVLLAPTVEIRPLDDPRPLDAVLARLSEYDWLVFTSANGVRHFLDRLLEIGGDLRALGRTMLAVIGPGTAQELSRYHLRADLMPETYRSESLAESLARRAAGRKILLARADRGRDVLRAELGQVALVDQVAVYRNVDVERLPEDVEARLQEGSVDWITLTSSAIAARMHTLCPEPARARIGREIRLASLSPVTSESITRMGWQVSAEASVYTWEGLVEAIVEQVAAGRRDA